MPYQRFFDQNKHLFNVWSTLEINDILIKLWSHNLYFYHTIFCVRKKPTIGLLDILSEVGRRKNLITRVWSEVAKDEWAGQKNSMKEKYFVRKNHENLMSLSAIKRICSKKRTSELDRKTPQGKSLCKEKLTKYNFVVFLCI